MLHYIHLMIEKRRVISSCPLSFISVCHKSHSLRQYFSLFGRPFSVFHMARMQAGNLRDSNTNTEESEGDTEWGNSKQEKDSNHAAKTEWGARTSKRGYFCHTNVVWVWKVWHGPGTCALQIMLQTENMLHLGMYHYLDMKLPVSGCGLLVKSHSLNQQPTKVTLTILKYRQIIPEYQ